MITVTPYTTYKDKQGRQWVVIDLDYFGRHTTVQELPQVVVLYQVGTNKKIQQPTYAEFLSYIEDGLMILVK